MSEIAEKVLDRASGDAFRFSRDFADWFLTRTKFTGTGPSITRYSPIIRGAACLLPSVTQRQVRPKPGGSKARPISFSCLANPGSTRFALRIENTLAMGTFTPDQPDFYLARARHMADNPSYGDYADFDTVLTAPRKFYGRWPDGCAKFERYISHEDIPVHLPIFSVKNP